MLLRALVVWFGLLGLAVLNGAFRETVLVRNLGSQHAGQVSTLLLCALILGATLWAVPWIRPVRSSDALVIGGTWVVLTLIFEFGFGLLQGKTFRELMADYNVLRGRIWVLVLVTTAFAPLLMARLRGVLRAS